MSEITTDKKVTLRDQRGRPQTYLRLSVTDRCNLRCRYCMPPEGIERLSRDRILRPEEIGVITRLFVRTGVRKIRLTGGEPLIRGGLDAILQELAVLPDPVTLALTTNGVLLERWLDRLVEAGVTRINVSLDSLKRDRYARITGINGWDSVWSGINAALNHPGIESVKLNVVVQRGINDDEVKDFARLTLEHPLDVRFIEVMPVAGVAWHRGTWVSGGEITAGIGERLETLPSGDADGGPSRHYRLPGALGRIGVISSLSRPACRNCNRLRLTARGNLLRCLHEAEGLDLRRALRENRPEAEILQEIVRFVQKKRPEGGTIALSAVSGNRSPCLATVGG